MTDLYLIAHKVRGEPAFDIASRMTCPHCRDPESGEDTMFGVACHECDGLGYWWIIPTSGHRAYPIMNWPLTDLYDGDCSVITEAGPLQHHPKWNAIQDHYPTRSESQRDLVALLGLIHKPLAPAAPIKRRF